MRHTIRRITVLAACLFVTATAALGEGTQMAYLELPDALASDDLGNAELAPHDGDSLEDRYDELAQELDELKKSLGQISRDTKHFVKPGHREATMNITGRVNIDYWAFPSDLPGVNAFETGDPMISPQDRIGIRRLRFGVGGDLPENMEYRIEMEFAGGNRTEFRDVWLGWNELPILRTLLVGNQKRPYGLDHINSSRFNVFIERAFIVEAFNQDSRRLGVVSYGVSADERYNWRFGVYNLRLIQDEGNYTSDHYQLEVAGRLANTFLYDEESDGTNYAHWAVSGTVADPDGRAGGDPPTVGLGRAQNEARFRTRPEARTVSAWLDTLRIDGADIYGILGAEGVVNIGPLQLVGEYMNLWLGRMPEFGDDLRFHGGYLYLSYFLTGEHMPWDRERGRLDRVKPFENFYLVDTCCDGIDAGRGAWQVAVRWSLADLTDRDVAGGVGESLTFGLNWWWTPFARMQFNYLYGNIHDHTPVAGETFGNYHILGTRLAVDF